MSMNRVCIQASLTLTSPMHIGTGQSDSLKDHDGVERSVAAITLDHYEKPYIPGSALKGMMRDALIPMFATGSDTQKEAFKAVFGMPPEDTGSSQSKKQQGIGGKAVFQDAFLHNQKFSQAEETATAHNPKTGAAKNRTLRTTINVSAGTTFDVEIMLDNACDSEIAVIKKGLELFKSSAVASLGGGTRTGHGRFRIVDIAVKKANASSIAAWLAKHDGHWSKGLDFSLLNPNTDSAKICEMTGLADNRITASIKLHFAGQMLTCGETIKENGVATVQPYKQGDDYILTGRSVLGVLRARARRICLTLDKDIKDNNSPFRQLFGGTGYDGALSVSNFSCDKATTEAHEMVAIDRFTGGAKDQNKFRNRILEHPVFAGTLSLRFSGRTGYKLSDKEVGKAGQEKLTPAALGLLALVLRDLAEGDLTFGSGASKGYGALAKVELTGVSGGVTNGVYDNSSDAPFANVNEQSLGTENVQNAINEAVEAFNSKQEQEAQTNAPTD